jgi:hypothetical protein
MIHLKVVSMQKDCQRPDFNQMLSVVWKLFRRFGKIYIDGSNPSFIWALKIQIGEDEEYDVLTTPKNILNE